jgi:hypothetical protein
MILNAPWISAWDRYCERHGRNPWALNEGLADGDEVVTLSLEEAREYGLLKD